MVTHQLSRRSLLAGTALAIAGTSVAWAERGEAGTLENNPPPQPGGRCSLPVEIPTGELAIRNDGSFASARRGGRTVRWTLLVPPGVPREGLRLALVLPGRGSSSSAVVDVLRGDAFLPDAVRQGTAPFALLGVDTQASYWHPRKGGDDPIGMLTGELLPDMAQQGFDTSRIGVLGWSMGGFGALLLARESAAGRLRRTRVVAAAAGAPALFAKAELSSRGAFDSRRDFDRWGRLAERPGTGSIPLMVDCGVEDRFLAQVRRYRSHVTPTPAGGIGPGCHSGSWFRSLAPAQLRFLGQFLA